MTNPEIPEEAVKAVAIRCGHARGRSEPNTSDFETARGLLAAALPHLRVQETPAASDLHAALTQLVDKWQYTDGKGYRGFYDDVVDLLADHPAPSPRPVVDRQAVIAALHNYDHGHQWGEPICERYACEHIYPVRADVVLALLPTEEGEGS